ncbi:MAG: CtsR family transcriptional regulator [Dethiobacteria bacterium]
MFTIADYIEDYIKKLLSLSMREWVVIQRGELAGKFNCVPSQINYVLSTRFTPERGYLVESRRGGRGYIRIMRVKPLSQGWDRYFEKEGLDPRQAVDLLKRLYDERFISRREAAIIERMLRDEVFKGLPINERQKNILVKRLLDNMIMAVLKDNQ